MKAVILAGGIGTRLVEETVVRPKPMVEIGGKPIIWHIMKLYSVAGITDFIVCLGYKGHVIKEYFSDFFLYNSDVTFDLQANEATWHNSHSDPWRVTLIDTGEKTMTGGRLARIARYLDNEPFCMTYGDAVANINIGALVRFHKAQHRLATVTVVEPYSRFGCVEVKDGNVLSFQEKPAQIGAWISGGFFVLERNVLDLIDGDACIWELGPMETLTNKGELAAYQHRGFFHCMDNMRDKQELERFWQEGAPWKIW